MLVETATCTLSSNSFALFGVLLNIHRFLVSMSTSIRLDDILHSSVETLGSAGFKSLLLPELKLDGQSHKNVSHLFGA